MRRLTIEMDLNEMIKFEDNPMLLKIRSLEIVQFLKDGPDEFAAIFRIDFGDNEPKVEDLMDDDLIDLQMLDHEKEGVYTYFIKSRPLLKQQDHFHTFLAGGYLTYPFEIKDGKARISYLGSTKAIRAFLDGVERVGIKYRVAAIMDAKFPQDSPLSRLTERQRRVLIDAYRLGYYDEPRRISSLELARRMKINSSTLINHRRRAERHLLAELIGR